MGDGMIILDLGNGSVCQNKKDYIKDTIDAVAEVDVDRVCNLKWQLFVAMDGKTAMRRELFEWAYQYADELGFRTTASYFDFDSYMFLLGYDIPFIKIANQSFLRRSLDATFHGSVISVPDNILFEKYVKKGFKVMCCVSKYPADNADYDSFKEEYLMAGISDHTDNLELFHRFKPEIYEKHFVLEKTTYPQPRVYALRPEGLEELLEMHAQWEQLRSAECL
jgi:sialic acid synthase SpsE